MLLSRFNKDGIASFRSYLDTLVAEPTVLPPMSLLTDTARVEPLPGKVEVSNSVLSTRLEVGRQLLSWIEASGASRPELDSGIWTWLSLLLFDTVCPSDGVGLRKPGKYNRHIAEVDSWQKRHRHLLLSPFLVYRAHRDAPERALSLLCQPAHKPGDVVTQITERQEYWTNKGVVETATELYIDPVKKSQKTGAQNKGKGGARRFADLLNQLDLNWYLYGMSCEELMSFLPKEFQRFQPQPS